MMGRLAVSAAAVAVLAMFAASAPAGAAPIAPQSKPIVLETAGDVQLVAYRYCRSWRFECSRRWGWGGWRYQRCLRLKGC